jgi:hypothetical protein
MTGPAGLVARQEWRSPGAGGFCGTVGQHGWWVPRDRLSAELVDPRGWCASADPVVSTGRMASIWLVGSVRSSGGRLPTVPTAEQDRTAPTAGPHPQPGGTDRGPHPQPDRTHSRAAPTADRTHSRTVRTAGQDGRRIRTHCRACLGRSVSSARRCARRPAAGRSASARARARRSPRIRSAPWGRGRRSQ